MKTESRREGFSVAVYVVFSAVTLGLLVLCVSVGSVSVPPGDTLRILSDALLHRPAEPSQSATILLSVRLPRVLATALVGASLSISGAAMQGLLKNPLADGSTLGVSSGASLGAVLAIAFGVTFPVLPFAGTVSMAILFAFLSLVLILSLAYRLDRSLSTNTILLIGVIYSMFVSSILSLIITLRSSKLRQITFWTMGSLAGSTYPNVLLLLVTLIVCAAVLLALARELNAFSVGEDNARHIGVNVTRTKWLVLAAVSALIGVSVSVGGTIGFVGLVTPHMVRLVTGGNHKKLLPASLFSGAWFLMLCDLAARTLFSPQELPIGVITSQIGAVVFVALLANSRRRRVRPC